MVSSGVSVARVMESSIVEKIGDIPIGLDVVSLVLAIGENRGLSQVAER
jgi:hypothetical protein